MCHKSIRLNWQFFCHVIFVKLKPLWLKFITSCLVVAKRLRMIAMALSKTPVWGIPLLLFYSIFVSIAIDAGI